MIESYDEFIEKTKKAYPDMFEALGEEYFKRVYDNAVKNENDYKRIKKAFIATPLVENGCLVDLSRIDDVTDNARLLRYVQYFGQDLMWILGSDRYDALYVCPEVASFMKLSPFFKEDSEVPNGVYKFGTFGNEEFKYDCYKAPNEVAEKDCILLHSKDDTWRKAEVKISDFYQKKYELAEKQPMPQFEL